MILRYFSISLLLLGISACTTPKSPAQDVYLAESAYVVALKQELKYCGKSTKPKICPQIRIADDMAWEAIKKAQVAVRDPNFGENKVKTAVASATALTNAFIAIAELLEE